MLILHLYSFNPSGTGQSLNFFFLHQGCSNILLPIYHYRFQDFRSVRILDHDKKDRFSLQEKPCMVQELKSQQSGGPFDTHQTPEIEKESVPFM